MDLWISVRTSSTGSTMPPVFLFHYDGSALTDDPVYLWIAPISSMWGADGAGFWIAHPGFFELTADGYRIPALRRHDGQGTTDVFIDGTEDPDHSIRLTSVWGAAADDVWAAGSGGFPEEGTLAHFDGRCWRLVSNGPAASRHDQVSGAASTVWLTSAGPRFFRLDR